MDSETLNRPIESLRIREPICLPPSATAREAIERLQQARTGCVLVTDAGRLVGVFTERDVLRKLADHGAGAADLRLGDVMTPRPVALQTDDSIVFALNRMHIDGYRHIPLVNHANEPVGIISVRDIVDYVVEHFEDTVRREAS